MDHERHNHLQRALILLVFIPVAAALCRRTSGGGKIGSGQVWREVQKISAAQNLDPRFVYAITLAESGLNPHAGGGDNRGLMQLSRAAWVTVSRRPFAEADDWRVNVEVGAAYLAHLRRQLEKAGRFSYPLLAACYRHGYGEVARHGFDPARLPPPTNEIYKLLFAGALNQIPLPQE